MTHDSTKLKAGGSWLYVAKAVVKTPLLATCPSHIRRVKDARDAPSPHCVCRTVTVSCT